MENDCILKWLNQVAMPVFVVTGVLSLLEPISFRPDIWCVNPWMLCLFPHISHERKAEARSSTRQRHVSFCWLASRRCQFSGFFLTMVTCYLDHLDVQRDATPVHCIYGIMAARTDERESANIPDPLVRRVLQEIETSSQWKSRTTPPLWSFSRSGGPWHVEMPFRNER